MDPERFIKLAGTLATSDREERLRSAVSRAYYGAFHVARQLIGQLGFHLPRNKDVHAYVAECLQSCGHDEAALAGSQLGTLRTDRNLADYNLHDTIFKKQKNAQIRVERARDIVAAIGRCQSEAAKSQIRNGIAAYDSAGRGH